MMTTIYTDNLTSATDKAWHALQSRNNDKDYSQFFFMYGEQPSRFEHNAVDRIVPVRLTPDRMRHRLSQIASWVRPVAGRAPTQHTGAPMEIVKNVLATPDPPLPKVDRVVDVPVLAADGSVHIKPGYSRRSRVFHEPAPNLDVPRVATRPTKAERRKAVELFRSELLADFPFVGEAERAHAVALILQPFVRDLIDGPTPLYLIEAPTPGTGKGLLAHAACWAAIGGPVATMTEGRDEDEWRKRVTATLRESPTAVLIDNLRERLDSAAVSAALTGTVWKDRKLGVSENLTLPNRATWIATGNNPALSGEIMRRSVRIRMDPDHEHPEDRVTFRHPDLLGWAASHRGNLIWAALTLSRSWIANGRRDGSAKRLGSFESWSRVMGGILELAEVPGFLGNLTDLREHAQAENDQMHAFLLAWYEQHGSTAIKARDVGQAAETLGVDPFSQRGKTALGKLLGQHKDRRYGNVILRRSKKQRDGVALWNVERVNQRPGNDSG